ncbi:MAG: class IV adenylate cyclase [Candidatus Thorarchaeota archaeon]
MKEPKYEVELKLPINDIDVMESKLVNLGAKKINSEIQIDAYLDHPCKSFPETDEALRLRSRVATILNEGVDPPAYAIMELTYKGPKIDPMSKTRVELSVGVDNTDELNEILMYLGFKHVVTIRKKRTFYSIRDITASVDDVEGVGIFLELEQVVDSKAKIEANREELFALVRELGLDPGTSIRKSYLELFNDRNSL